MPFDISISEDMTLLSDQGFANALFHCCNLKPGAGHLSAPVCSTFVLVPPVSKCVGQGGSKPFSSAWPSIEDQEGVIQHLTLEVCFCVLETGWTSSF